MENSRGRTESLLHAKSYAFALRIVQMNKFLRERQEFVLSKQVMRSGTAIGALVRESEFAQSKADFVNKLNIALKEANETDYWLNLLKDSGYLSDKSFSSIETDCGELIALLISSIKTARENLRKMKNDE
ncbi:MAG TPA: four helix bundle protein [Bacteroides sp.]|nr:four helix bundle protein [Bacteroides sp.]